MGKSTEDIILEEVRYIRQKLDNDIAPVVTANDQRLTDHLDNHKDRENPDRVSATASIVATIIAAISLIVAVYVANNSSEAHAGDKHDKTEISR